jgi:N-methylhydantoinase A
MAIIETRPAYFDGTWRETPHYDRGRLGIGDRVEGPAIIRQYDTTTVLLPGHYAEVDPHGNILIWPVAKGR